MDKGKIEIIEAQLRSFKSTLEKATDKQKEGLVTIALAENFNRMVEQTIQLFPELKDHLPQKIESATSMKRRAGVSDVNYLDLEILTDQVFSLIQLKKS